MVKPTPVLSAAGDYEEALERYAKHLGQSQIRRQVFDEIYGRVRRPRSKKQIMAAAGIDESKSQQVQNQLEHLYKHHLIERPENDGSVTDGSRYVYGKAEFIRANKSQIVRLADNPKLASVLPTKRRRQGNSGGPSIDSLRKRNHVNILYLTANPNGQERLRVDAEVRMVQNAIRGSIYRDNISLRQHHAADLDSLITGLNDYRPQIIHFSGHGNQDELLTDTGGLGGSNESVLRYDLLAKALSATDSPPSLIVLNSCDSAAAETHLVKKGTAVIGMGDSVSDLAAANFAQKFYAGIASGQSVKSAFEQGRVAVEETSISESNTPKLFTSADDEPSSMVIA